MLPAWFVIFAALIRLLGGATYAWAVIKKRARPNPVTWFFWALTPLIVFFAQIVEGVSWGLAITFALGFGPLVIFILSLKDNMAYAHFTPSTIICGILAALGVILWLSTSDPTLAIIFSIAADVCGSIPTLIKIYRHPASEFLPAYLISVLSVTISLLAIHEWSFANYAYPAYIFVINLSIFGTGYIARLMKKHRLSK